MEITPTESTIAYKFPKSNINWKYQFQQYGAALAVAMFLFVVLSVYLLFRRGYYDLYITNKIFAGVAAILLGIVLLIGPLSRFFSFPDRYVQYRKELGIVAFFIAFIHGIVSLFFLPSRFPLSGFLGILNWPFVFGLAATIVLVAIFFISNDCAMIAIGRKRWWWWLQYWLVRFTFALIILHVFIMKWSGWVSWYKVGGGKELAHPEWPGAGLLVGWFLSFVVLVRLAEFGGLRFGCAVVVCELNCLANYLYRNLLVGKTIHRVERICHPPNPSRAERGEDRIPFELFLEYTAGTISYRRNQSD